MAKTKAKISEVEQQEDENVLIETGVELSDALSRLYAENGISEIEAKAHVYIVNAETGRDEKIWDGVPEDYNLSELAKKHGSGDYRLMVYVKTDAGNFGRKINRVQTYRLSPEEDARLRSIRKGELVPTQQQSQGVTAETIAQAVAAALKAIMPAPVAPANNLGMLKEVAEIVRTLAPQPVLSTQPQFNPMEVFRLAADFARDRNRDDDEPIKRGVNASGTDVFMRLIDRFGPMFAQSIQQNGNAVLATPVASASEKTDTVATSPEAEAMIKLKMGIAFLVMQANAGNDPTTYADVVLDNVPQEDLMKFVNSADPVAYLANINSDVSKHAQWFKDLLEEVKAELNAPEGDAAGVDAEAIKQ